MNLYTRCTLLLIRILLRKSYTHYFMDLITVPILVIFLFECHMRLNRRQANLSKTRFAALRELIMEVIGYEVSRFTLVKVIH